MFCILMKKRNGNDKKKNKVGPTGITKSNVGWWGGKGCQGSEGCAGWQWLGCTTGAQPGDATAARAGAECSWAHPSGSSGRSVLQSRRSAQPDGCQQVFCRLSIARTVLGRKNHVPGGTAQSCTSSPIPTPCRDPPSSPTGLSPAQDTDPSPQTRDMKASVGKAFGL